ncbi:MAG: 50S ribosomal protein L29 [Phycisphaerales bacterium]|nr:50S ribosomal protein L29 [Phycisphaerales bacterium]
MDMKEIKKLNDEELGIETTRIRRVLFDLRSSVVSEKLKDTTKFVKTRVELARVLTEVSARRVAKATVVRKPVAVTPTARKPVVRKKVKS